MSDVAALRRIQRFVQAVVVHPGETRRAAAAAAQRELAGTPPESILLPSRTLAGVERLGIYQGMYLRRMRDALAADYPVLARTLGEETFWEFVRGYVQRHPSRSYTLKRLGDDVPSYLGRTRRFPHRRFLADLARLERAVTEVFDAEAPEAVRRIRPAGVRERTTFRPSPTLRFLSLRYPAGAYLDAVRQGLSPAIPRPARTRIALWRVGTAVRRLDLSAGADALLRRLVAGRALGDALRSLDARQRRDLPERAIVGLFRSAVAGRMLVPI